MNNPSVLKPTNYENLLLSTIILLTKKEKINFVYKLLTFIFCPLLKCNFPMSTNVSVRRLVDPSFVSQRIQTFLLLLEDLF